MRMTHPPQSTPKPTTAGSLPCSRADLEQAVVIANLGLLASMDLGVQEISATGRRLVVEVIDELEVLAQAAAP